MQYRLYIIDLYDIYGNLLTGKQKEYFELYYFDNLSLSEISQNDNVSRNSIHKHIKNGCLKLENYEEKLKIYERNEKIIKFSTKLNEKEQKELKELIKKGW